MSDRIITGSVPQKTFGPMTDSREFVTTDDFAITVVNDGIVVQANNGVRIYLTVDNQRGELIVRGGMLETATIGTDGEILFHQ